MVTDILEAAARIIEERGLDELTTNAVAQRAGVSVGSLYQYFPSRTAILAELTRRERALLRDRMKKEAQGLEDASLEEAVTVLVQVAIRHQFDRPALARALDFVEPSLTLGEEAAGLSGDISVVVHELLVRHGTAHPDTAARDLVAMAKGVIDAAGLAGETDLGALAARVRRACLGYLAPELPPARVAPGSSRGDAAQTST